VIIGKTHIRLAGIAAPSLQQHCIDASGVLWTCGISARDELARHVGKQPWTCQTVHNERHKCTVGNEDVAKWLVHSGWALAGRVNHDYDAEETAAKTAKAGLWAGAFVAPQEWRRRNAQAPVLGTHPVGEASRAVLYPGRQTSTSPSPECAIKGHVNRSGTCIYHLPGGRWYARVVMEPDNGDRWFCSKEEADAAGCRETKR
jgi:hypothetical protein